MPINSRQKGKRIERLACQFLTKIGFPARRGQQFSGGNDSPDVVCDALPMIHFEVKGVKAMDEDTQRLDDAWEQAVRDAGDKIPVVMWKPGRAAWRVTFIAEKPGLRVTVSGRGRIKAVLLWMSQPKEPKP